MKEELDEVSKAEFIYYRAKRAEETLLEADCLADNGHYNGAINRLYYACYYIVSSLLMANDIQATTHVGVRSMFALKFIKNGTLDISYGKFFNEIFELRHSNDYDDLRFCDEETYNSFRPKASDLINTVKTLL